MARADISFLVFWGDGTPINPDYHRLVVGENIPRKRIKAKLRNYLESGQLIDLGLIPRKCFVCDKFHENLSNGFFTDGVFVWPINTGSIYHYHNIELPLDFLNHATKSGYKARTLVSREELGVINSFIQTVISLPVAGKSDPEGYPLY